MTPPPALPPTLPSTLAPTLAPTLAATPAPTLTPPLALSLPVDPVVAAAPTLAAGVDSLAPVLHTGAASPLDPRLEVRIDRDAEPPSAAVGRRQRAVESLGIQVDHPEERFDRIVRVAGHVFGTPMAAITVIDGDQALFPGAYGLDVRSIGLDNVLCSMTLGGDVVVLSDIREDPLLSLHPAAREFGVAFYAGHPLKDPFGNVVGTLALFDFVPRTLDAAMLAAFDDLAGWAQQELVASTEMVQATKIQASLLPAQPLRVDDWEIVGLCLPSLAVGGDFYDYQVDNGVARLGVGDVMGKGTGAALVCAGVRSALRGTHTAVVSGADLGDNTTQVARTLYPDLAQSESFVTLFRTAIDLADGATRYVDAGCGLCLVVRADGTLEGLHGDDGPLGVMLEDAWTEHHTRLEPGDRMLIFSDGLLDLLEDPRRWWVEVGRLVADHTDPGALLQSITDLSRRRTVTDDVTALAVYRSDHVR